VRAFDQITLRPVAPVAPKPARDDPWQAELEALLPADFLERATSERLDHLPRYLKALATRIERARLNPTKDRERVERLRPYLERLRALESRPAGSSDRQAALAEFRQAVEEFRVSLFAQELGTAFPVSPQRLDELVGRVMNTP
jgi:ATP-dependent helicase HrpA